MANLMVPTETMGRVYEAWKRSSSREETVNTFGTSSTASYSASKHHVQLFLGSWHYLREPAIRLLRHNSALLVPLISFFVVSVLRFTSLFASRPCSLHIPGGGGTLLNCKKQCFPIAIHHFKGRNLDGDTYRVVPTTTRTRRRWRRRSTIIRWRRRRTTTSAVRRRTGLTAVVTSVSWRLLRRSGGSGLVLGRDSGVAAVGRIRILARVGCPVCCPGCSLLGRHLCGCALLRSSCCR